MNSKQHAIYAFLLLTLLVNATALSAYGQGKLGRVRDAVRNSKPAKSPKPKKQESKKDRHDDRRSQSRKTQNNDRRHHRSRRRNRNTCNSGIGFVVDGFFAPPVNEVHVVHHHPAPIIASPVVVSSPAPVYQPVVAPVPEQSIVETESYFVQSDSYDWVGRLSVLGATDFDDITQGGLGLLLQAPGGLGLDTSVTMLRESGMSFRDHLYLGDVNLVYEPVCTDSFRLRVGIGLNWLGDSYGGDAGFNMTSGFDWRATDRWNVTGEVDFGTIGDTDLTHGQISIGRMINQRTEWSTGYDYRDIGGVTIGSAFTGLRFRF